MTFGRKHIVRFLALMSLAVAVPASACGLRSTANPPIVYYDPFNPNVPSSAVLSMQFTATDLADLKQVRLFFKSNNAVADGAVVRVTSVSDIASAQGLNENIFVGNAAVGPNLLAQPIPPNAYLQLGLGDGASRSFAVTITIMLPSNLNLLASSTLPFDIYYTCEGGGSASQIIPNALVIPIQVISALQASYAGPAFDFGDIEPIATDGILAAPYAYTVTGQIRVASSGPYNVEISSSNGYRLLAPGGDLTRADQSIAYQTAFLGRVLNPSNAQPLVVTCKHAPGSAITADLLPLAVTLLEGGRQKQPSSTSYSDTLVISITPLAAETPASGDCAR